MDSGLTDAERMKARDCLDSIAVGEAMVDLFIAKVAEIQYNKILDTKKKPYVVLHTTLQSLTCVEMLELKHDRKTDDYLLSDIHREMDHEEPPMLGKDCMQPHQEMKQRDPPLHLTMGITSNSSNFALQPKEMNKTKTSMPVRKETRKKVVHKNSSSLNRRDLAQATSVQFDDEFSKAAEKKGDPSQTMQVPRAAEPKRAESKRDETSPQHSSRDEDERDSIGRTSIGSAPIRLPKKNKIKKQKKEEINFAERTYQVEMQVKEDDNEEFVTKLEELRVEVYKRDIQRKFEAMQNQPQKGKLSGRGGLQPGTTLVTGSPTGGGGITTDHNGNLIQMKQGAPHMLVPTQTSVTVSNEQSVVKQDRLKALVRQMTNMSRDSQASALELSIKTASKQGSVNNRRSSIAKIESQKTFKGNKTSMSTNEGPEVETKQNFVNPDDVLGHTTSSNFGKRRTDKEFAQMQTRDYERSIQMLEMADGVSLSHGGGAIQAKQAINRPKLGRDKFSSQNMSILHKMKSVQQSVLQGNKGPPMSAYLNENSVFSADHQFSGATPNTRQDIRRSLAGVENGKLMFSPLMKKVDENGNELNSSEIQQHMDETALMNSSLISGRSRESHAFKSKSQAKARRGNGRILQNNMSEVASYLADGMQPEQRSKMSYSRYEILSHSKESIERSREQNISRLLGKQQSEARLRVMQVSKGGRKDVDQRNSTISMSVINQHGYTARGVERDGTLMAGDSILDSQLNPATDIEGSFSYLPSIYGVGKAKQPLQQSGSTVEMSARRAKFGPYSLAGKKPLLIANYRRAQHQGPGFAGGSSSIALRDGSIRLVDPMKARELVREQSIEGKKLSSHDLGLNSGAYHSSGVATDNTQHNNRQEYAGARKLHILRKGMGYLTDKGVTSEQKPSKANSLQKKASRNAY